VIIPHVVAIVLKLGWKFFWAKDRPKNCDEKECRPEQENGEVMCISTRR